MEVEFKNDDLRRLAVDEKAIRKLPQGVARVYQRRVAFILGAKDTRDLGAMRGTGFEKLKGARSHQHSMRLNDQFRLILEIRPGSPGERVLVVGIEDYHS
jgi:proteic killer suppression protein